MSTATRDLHVYVVHGRDGYGDSFREWVDSIWSSRFAAADRCMVLKSGVAADNPFESYYYSEAVINPRDKRP